MISLGSDLSNVLIYANDRLSLRAGSSVWLERFSDKEEAESSNLSLPNRQCNNWQISRCPYVSVAQLEQEKPYAVLQGLRDSDMVIRLIEKKAPKIA